MRPRRSVTLAALAVAAAVIAILWSCTEKSGTTGTTPTPLPTATSSPPAIPTLTPTASPMPTSTPPPKPPRAPANPYPWHTNIVSTTFWVGEIFDPNASDGSQVISTYDAHWYANYGGCDGVVANGDCSTERRTAQNGYFPLRMTPKQNPFYLDLPFDDINDPAAFARRGQVIPWATSPKY
ncbi:MAG: hypothetical protein QOH44_1517, partial [Actinomycetota bacterium]|nr:hypothetical protein [Actinomycetota bacterium]